MSENKDLQALPTHDFTMKDLELIEKFKEGGLLGLAHVDDTDVHRMLGLYLDGKSYRQIADLTKKNKSIILYLANKMDWYQMRTSYLEELQLTMPDKIVASKLKSKEFLLELTMAYQKKISRNIHDYLRTDNTSFTDKIDPKDINTLLKVMDMLHKFTTDPSPADRNALVGLNGLGEGVNITKTGANSIEITPKGPGPIASKLRQFADLKREMERSSQTPKTVHDIVVDKPLTKEESEENEDENQ